MPIRTRDPITGRVITETELPEEARQRQQAEAEFGEAFGEIVNAVVTFVLAALIALGLFLAPTWPLLTLGFLTYSEVAKLDLPPSVPWIAAITLVLMIAAFTLNIFFRRVYMIALTCSWAILAAVQVLSKSDMVWAGFAGLVAFLVVGGVLWRMRQSIDDAYLDSLDAVKSLLRPSNTGQGHEERMILGLIGLLLFIGLPFGAVSVASFDILKTNYEFHTLFALIAAALIWIVPIGFLFVTASKILHIIYGLLSAFIVANIVWNLTDIVLGVVVFASVAALTCILPKWSLLALQAFRRDVLGIGNSV